MIFGIKAKVFDLAVFHDFAPPPTGGGHQFMRALCSVFESRGLRLEYNQLSPGTPNCFFNSYNFQFKKLRRALRKNKSTHCVHRIDGPLQTYRGFDDGTDQLISDFNRSYADQTIVQSKFSLEKHQELGLSAVHPVLIGNTPDPNIFHAKGRRSFIPDRKCRIISASWSDNPHKGLEIYKWLDANLDFSKVEYTFVGRIQTTLKNIRQNEPIESEPLADLLRSHDIYLTASRNDPCSNSVVEAMACGLPVLYLNSGGHPELVKQAGIGFESAEEIPQHLEILRQNYTQYQSAIEISSIQSIADQYLERFDLSNYDWHKDRK